MDLKCYEVYRKSECASLVTEEQAEYVYLYTLRKVEVAKQDDSYVPILFETELRDYVTRENINTISALRTGGYISCVTSV